MADVIDPGAVFGRQKSLRDYNVDNALKNQAITEGDLKNANAANLYRTQVLTGAIASGDQEIYDAAKQRLGQRGIDVSDLAPDIGTGAAQIQAMRQAQYASNPLNAMLGLGLKAEGNLNSAAGTMGSTGAAAAMNPLSAAIAGRMAGGAGVMPMPGAAPRAPAPAAGDPLQESLAAIEAQQAQTGVSPAQRPDLALPVTAGLKKGAPMPAAGAAGGEGVEFTPPAQNAGETAQAYNNRVNIALQAWKENPGTKKAQKSADSSGGKQGDEIGELAKTVNIMSSNLPIVMQRFSQMRDASKNASSGAFVDPESGHGLADSVANMAIIGSSDRADANGVLQQRAAQGILPELGPQLQQAGVKGNRFLEQIANSASGLKMNAPPETKVKLIDGLQMQYINNLKASAAQLRHLGQPAPSDAEIDAMVMQNAGTPQPTGYSKGMVKHTPSGSYVLIGDDPTQQASWQKVQ